MSTTDCPACDSQRIDEEIEKFDGVCEDCGLVINTDMEQQELAWNVIDSEPGGEQEEWLTQARIRNATEQRIAHALDTLEEMSDQLGLSSDIRGEAAEVYSDAVICGETDGRETPPMVAACLRIGSLRLDEPIPQARLADFEDVDQRKIRLCISALKGELELKLQAPEPRDYLPFVKATLNLIDAEVQAVRTLLRDIADDPALVGKDPAGIVATGVYLTQENRTQEEVADAVGVSTETVRKRAHQLESLASDD